MQEFFVGEEIMMTKADKNFKELCISFKRIPFFNACKMNRIKIVLSFHLLIFKPCSIDFQDTSYKTPYHLFKYFLLCLTILSFYYIIRFFTFKVVLSPLLIKTEQVAIFHCICFKFSHTKNLRSFFKNIFSEFSSLYFPFLM